jgi:hypothetical protein
MFTIVSDNIEVLQESPTPGPRPTRGRPKSRPGSNYVTPPEGTMTIVDFSPQPLASTLPHAPGRPTSAAVMRGSGGRPSPYTGAMQVHRPGSAPAPKGYHGVLTPGEHLLAAPHLSTVLTTPGARRPAAEELQYELSVTAAVLRAAQDRLIQSEDLLRSAGRDAAGIRRALDAHREFFRMDIPPVRKGVREEPGYDEVLSRLHNPIVARKQFAEAGFKDVRVLFYHYHCLPPQFEAMAPEFFRKTSLRMEDPEDWRGHFMASAFVLAGVAS